MEVNILAAHQQRGDLLFAFIQIASDIVIDSQNRALQNREIDCQLLSPGGTFSGLQICSFHTFLICKFVVLFFCWFANLQFSAFWFADLQFSTFGLQICSFRIFVVLQICNFRLFKHLYFLKF